MTTLETKDNIIGHFTYLYVIIISLILSILVYEW